MRIRNMEPGDDTNWRQALGSAIKAQREARGRTLRDVSRRAKVQIADVESWERGATVPNAEQWKALTHGVNRDMHLYTETWRKARAECDRERDTITRSIQVHTPNGTNGKPHTTAITTNIGDKLAGVGITPPIKPGALLPPIISQPTAPPPDARTVNPGQAVAYHAPTVRPQAIDAAKRAGQTAREQMGIPEERGPDGRRLPPPIPAGGRSQRMIAKKTAFVRELILARPGIRTNGSDSVVEAVRLKFGVGISPETVDQVRAELGRERLKPTPEAVAESIAAGRNPSPEAREILETAKPSVFDGVSTDRARAFVEARANEPTSDDDIAAAVKLILDAIPNLQTFTIDVPEDGGPAAVDYQVREVKITTRTGSFKVPK